MKIRFRLLVTALILIPLHAFGQYYDTGQDPAGIKWLQIKTGRFTVIYPEKYSYEGIEFARTLDKSESALHSLFPVKKFRLPVVLHSYTTEANGYVAWAPKRMEIYPTPEQNTIPLENKTQLTLHELTHVMQMESLNSSTTHVLSFLFGEQAVGAFAAFLPLWYMEGNAVFAESILSESGRGRNPDFLKGLKALAVEKGTIYKYDKMVDGSYRNFVPDHYQSGYQAVTWSLASRDMQLWNKVLSFTAREPFVINPVNVFLSNNYKLTKRKLFTETFDTLTTLWKNDIEKSGAVEYKALNPIKDKQFANYYCPLQADAESIIAIKTSLIDPSSFVRINPATRQEKSIFIPGYIYPYFFSLGGDKLCWVETSVDPRWANRQYSVIRIFNLHSGISRRLTKKSRFMSASISPDGKVIAASENSVGNKNSLVFLNSSDGSELDRIAVPGNAYLQRPQWSSDGRKVTVILLTDKGEGIASYEKASSLWQTLIEPGRNDIQSSVLRNDTLFFTSSASGVENGYLMTPEGTIQAITNSRFGINDLTPAGGNVIFSDYTSLGNDICSLAIPSASGNYLIEPAKSALLIDRFQIKPEENDAGESTYTPAPYRKWQHLFNLHSWMPFYADPQLIESDPQSIRPGVTLMSQNILSTLTTTVSYEYSDMKRNILHTGFTWKGWYPVLETQLDYGDYPVIYKMPADPAPVRIYPGFKFKNTISLPLSFYSGRFNQFIYLSATADVSNNYIFISNSYGYDIRHTQLTSRFYIYNYYKSSVRDIYPRWAQMIDIIGATWPWDADFFGPDLAVKTALYFPGLWRNNSVRIRLETERQSFSEYLSSNRVNFPRSYKNIISGKLNFYSAEYFMPLCYPDFNISSVFYLTRLRGSIFYDLAKGRDNYYLSTVNGSFAATSHNAGPETFSSFGGQILADFHLFRIPYQITGGVQAAWKKTGSAPAIEAVFTMDINGTRIGRENRGL
jgi:hypothetical protein